MIIQGECPDCDNTKFKPTKTRRSEFVYHTCLGCGWVGSLETGGGMMKEEARDDPS